MADPRLFDGPVAVAQDDALDKLLALLADTPDAQRSFAEAYGNPHLEGSPASLVEAARHDHQVREAHGVAVLAQAVVHVLEDQRRRIGELEAAASKRKDKAGR